jgi:hypothetical protein
LRRGRERRPGVLVTATAPTSCPSAARHFHGQCTPAATFSIATHRGFPTDSRNYTHVQPRRGNRSTEGGMGPWVGSRSSPGTGSELNDLPIDLHLHRTKGPELVAAGAGLRTQPAGSGAQRSSQHLHLRAVPKKNNYEPAIIRGGVRANGRDLRHLVDVREHQAQDPLTASPEFPADPLRARDCRLVVCQGEGWTAQG